jgi:hypothetical protein
LCQLSGAAISSQAEGAQRRSVKRAMSSSRLPTAFQPGSSHRSSTIATMLMRLPAFTG